MLFRLLFNHYYTASTLTIFHILYQQLMSQKFIVALTNEKS